MDLLLAKRLMYLLCGVFVLNVFFVLGCNGEERTANKEDDSNKMRNAMGAKTVLNIDNIKTVVKETTLKEEWDEYLSAQIRKLIAFDYQMSQEESEKYSELSEKSSVDFKKLRSIIEECIEKNEATGNTDSRYCNKKEIDRLKQNIEKYDNEETKLLNKIRKRFHNDPMRQKNYYGE